MVKARNGIIAALDIGSSKVCCFIARVEGNNQLRVVGIGHQPSSGVKGGYIVDMEAAEHALSSAVNAAEQMCGERVEEVIVGVGGGWAVSKHAGPNVSERRADLETRNAGADLPDLWGRPPLVERHERQVSTGPAGVVAMAWVQEESTGNTGSPGGEGA